MDPAASPILVAAEPRPAPSKALPEPIPVEAPAPIVEKTCLDRLAPATLDDLRFAVRSAFDIDDLDTLIMAALRAVSPADAVRVWLAALGLLHPAALTSKSGHDNRGPQADGARRLAQLVAPDVAALLLLEAALDWSALRTRLGQAGSAGPSSHLVAERYQESVGWLAGRVARARRALAASSGKES
jgi:hypothetical protein